jgi:hypothetical protein
VAVLDVVARDDPSRPDPDRAAPRAAHAHDALLGPRLPHPSHDDRIRAPARAPAAGRGTRYRAGDTIRITLSAPGDLPEAATVRIRDDRRPELASSRAR